VSRVFAVVVVCSKSNVPAVDDALSDAGDEGFVDTEKARSGWAYDEDTTAPGVGVRIGDRIVDIDDTHRTGPVKGILMDKSISSQDSARRDPSALKKK
jgi:hypothetical protein